MANEPLFNCRCNWCGRDFEMAGMVTNICPDCRTIGYRAEQAALDQIKREHGRA